MFEGFEPVVVDVGETTILSAARRSGEPCSAAARLPADACDVAPGGAGAR